MKKALEETTKFYKEMGEESLQVSLQMMEYAVADARQDLICAPNRPLAWKIERVVHALARGNANAQQNLCNALSRLDDIEKMMEKDD